MGKGGGEEEGPLVLQRRRLLKCAFIRQQPLSNPFGSAFIYHFIHCTTLLFTKYKGLHVS